MSNVANGPRSLATLSGETVDQILMGIFEAIVLDLTESSTLWDLSPSDLSGTLRVLFKKFYHLRFVCKELNHRISYFAALWKIFPLGQMDQEDVRRSLERSKGSPITILLSDSRSRSNFDIILQQARHTRRIQRLYIDMRAPEWPGLSMIMQLYHFPALETLFFSSRGIFNEEESEGNGQNVPTWGVAPVAMSNAPVASRRRTQLSYKVGIAGLAHVTATVLCIRDSAFGWKYFAPPFQLTTLQVHEGYNAGDGTFLLNLAEFDPAIRSIHTLQQLQLWNVNAYGPRGLPPITDSNIRHIALRGPHGSIACISHYLRKCKPRILVLQISDTYSNQQEIVDADIQSSAEAFTAGHAISSVGIFVNFPDQTSTYGTTVDMVLTSDDDAIMSLQVPFLHAHALHPISKNNTTTSDRLSFDANIGEYTAEVIRILVQDDLHMGPFGSYHLCIEDRHIDAVLTALDQYRPRQPSSLVWLHGGNRRSAFARVASTHQQWAPYVSIAQPDESDDPEDSTLEHTEGTRWTDEQGKTLFSPSVPNVHEQLMRMSKYVQ